MIITKELTERAVWLVSPTARAILDANDCVWGPRWVEGFATAPGLGNVPFVLGQKTEWDPAWGEKLDFSNIAAAKLRVAARLGRKTSDVVATCPWLLQEGEYLYQGGVSRDGVSAATSGAKGWVDEALAEMVVNAVIMLAHLETDRRKAAKELKI